MTCNFTDYTGQKFGKLTVVETFRNNKYTKCRCVCECGNEKIINSTDLVRGRTKSCGCLKREKSKYINFKHGFKKTRLYTIWCGMKQRCNYEKQPCFKHYGGRGIEICKEWENDFIVFKDWAISNGYNDNLSIDRINVDGNYEPSNCRWITNKKQSNNRSNNCLINYKNKIKTLKEWCELLNINYYTTYSRIYSLGWTIEKAFEEI